jgi:hypothetical protein
VACVPARYHGLYCFYVFRGWAPSSIFTHIAALAFVHKINDWSDPTDCFVVRKLKEGCRRQGPRTDNRKPITHKLLCRLVEVLPSICRSDFEAAMFRAAFLLSFFGFLRVGEFASPSKSADTSRLISVTDMSFINGALELVIRYSKTDQRGISVLLVFQRAFNPRFCPVVAISEFLQLRGTVGGPLFIHFNGEPLTRHQFAHILKAGIKVLGLPHTDFTPHSFRIGAATSAAMCGLADSDIQVLGRWKSSAYKLYIRPGQLDSLY